MLVPGSCNEAVAHTGAGLGTDLGDGSGAERHLAPACGWFSVCVLSQCVLLFSSVARSASSRLDLLLLSRLSLTCLTSSHYTPLQIS